jgi:hypothetical protein
VCLKTNQRCRFCPNRLHLIHVPPRFQDAPPSHIILGAIRPCDESNLNVALPNDRLLWGGVVSTILLYLGSKLQGIWCETFDCVESHQLGGRDTTIFKTLIIALHIFFLPSFFSLPPKIHSPIRRHFSPSNRKSRVIFTYFHTS